MSVYFYGCITLDGYLADKHHGLDWLHQTGTPEDTNYESFYQSMDITIMGKRTFQEIAKYDDPHTFYPTTRNYVFTHSQSLPQAGFLPVNYGVVEFIRQIPEEKNIWIVGGNTLLCPLLDQNMVDFLIIQVAPVLLGNGIPLFTQKESLKRFQLEEVKKYGQFAELVYRKQ